MSGVYSGAALDLFQARGIEATVASKYGVSEEDGWLVYPTGKRRSLNGEGHRNPPGQMNPWCPNGKPEPGDTVLICEGETDALAALTACEHWPEGAPADPPSIISIPGASFPAARLSAGVAGCDIYLAFDPDGAGDAATERLSSELDRRCGRIRLEADLAETLNGSHDPGETLFDLLMDAEVIDPPPPPVPELDVETITGGRFIFDEGREYATLWGQGDQIIWAGGEPLLICGGDGTGKTTIAQQVALARIRGGAVLDFEVQPTNKKVLYIAADRPKQARRSLRRMVTEEERALLDGRFIVVPEVVQFDKIRELAQQLDADTVFIDTLGASSPGDIGKDSVGLELYHALQDMCRNNIEVCLLHHSRKQGQDYRGIEEVHGSRWITAPCGSVILLRGKPGADGAQLRHVKQPSEAIRGYVSHDHRAGKSYLMPDD